MPAVEQLDNSGERSGFLLTPEHEMFASFIAAGFSYRDAATKCGYHKDYGWDLARKPHIRNRIIELAAEPAEATKRSILSELNILRNRAAALGADPNVRGELICRLQILMAQAKLCGMIVEKKQVSKMSVARKAIKPADIEAYLEASLSEIAPDQAARIKQLAQGELAEEDK